MRAAVLRAAGDLVVEDRPTPTPGTGEVLVSVRSVGICGSDVHYFTHGRIGRFVVEAPLILGHEAAGIVTAVGPGVLPDRLGERVSIEPGVPDRTCPQCLAGRYNLCPAMAFLATPPIDGALAEHVVVPAAFAHRVPDTLSDDAAALLEPLSVGVWANRKGRVTAGSRVLVTGAGPIGLVAVQTALAFGATEVVVSDVNPVRLAFASALGATAVVDVRHQSLAESGVSADVLLECSGNAAATVAGLSALDRAGRAVLVGMGSDELPLPVPLLQERELELTGTFRYAGTWPTAIALVESGRVDLDRLVTSTHGLAGCAEALTIGLRDAGAVKAVVHPHQ